jgi:hypothetical protein
MKLVASRQLDRYPADLTTVDDKVVVLTSRDEATFLEAYDAHLVPVWSKRLEADAVALLAVDRTPRVLDSEGAWTCGDGGHCLARVRVSPREGMRLSAFGPVENGFVFAWQHDIRTPMRPPILERVNSDGTILWSVTLPVGSVSYEGVVQLSPDEGWKPSPMDPWIPHTWFSTSQTLPVSGDAVLVCFSDMPSSGIGFGYVVSLTDGALRFTTQKGPISEVAPIGEGAFLVGYQGYGAFETLHYDRDGRVPERWASHGYYLVGDGIRVIEMENRLPSKMHLVRLLPGGTVTKGEWLDGYHTSRPLLGADGTAYFFRKGAVMAARDLSIDEQLGLTAPDDGLFSTAIAGGEQGFYLAYTQVAGRTGASLVRIDL